MASTESAVECSERVSYLLVSEGGFTGGKRLKPLDVESPAKGEFSISGYDRLPGPKPPQYFRITDYHLQGEVEIPKNGKIRSGHPLYGLSPGTLISRKGKKVVVLDTKPSDIQQADEFWDAMDSQQGRLNQAERHIIQKIAGEYANEFRVPVEGYQSPIYKALTGANAGGIDEMAKKDLFNGLGDTQLPIEKRDIELLAAIVNRLFPEMNDTQKEVSAKILQTLKQQYQKK